jgi:hypothetical protein
MLSVFVRAATSAVTDEFQEKKEDYECRKKNYLQCYCEKRNEKITYS